MPSLSLSDPNSFMVMFIGMFVGAILKGATGAGLPIIAIPAIAAIYDVRIAVTLLVIPNFISNAWQIHKYKSHNLDNTFARDFALAGIAGAGVGTFLLAYLPLITLNIFIAVVVFSYITLRTIKPQFSLAITIMQKWAIVAGSCAGLLQGAIGLSAPIAITFLHSGRFARPTYIFIASLFFASMCLIQLPLQSALGLMTWEIIILSFLALIPIALGLPVGEFIGRRLSSTVFDQTILALLALLAIKMLFDAYRLMQ